MTGWRRLITATGRLAHRDGTRLQHRPADGRLLFEPVGESTSRSAERVRGIVTGAWALSGEICQACGGPGDPVTLSRGGRGIRCGDCREPGDRVLPRRAWRRKRETGNEAPGLLDDLVDLMEARHTPATHASWPVRRSQGDPYMTIVCPIDVPNVIVGEAKDGNAASIPLDKEGMAAALNFIKADAFGKWKTEGANKALTKAAKAAGHERFTTYQIHHSFAMGLRESGTDVADIQNGRIPDFPEQCVGKDGL